MADTKKKTKEPKLKIGWSVPREPKDEPPIKSLSSQAALDGMAAKASARSGPAYAPGIGKSS